MADPFTTDLRAARRRLFFPTLGGGLIVGPLAADYGWLTLDLPREAERVFLGGVAVVIGLALWLLALRQVERTRTFEQLAKGSVQRSPPVLRRALQELSGLPAWLFVAAFQHWIGAVLLLAVTVKFFSPSVQLVQIARMFATAIIFGAFNSFVSHFALTLTVRRVIGRLCQELEPREVFEALPPSRRRLRAWLVAFTVTFTVIPALLAVDASLVVSERDLKQALNAQDRGQQRELVLHARRHAFLPVGLLAAMSSAVAVAIAFAAGGALRTPMRQIAANVGLISSGQLGRPTVVLAEEEVWVVCVAFTEMQLQLAEAITQLARAGGRLSGSTTQMVETFSEQAAGSDEQASSLNETSATTEELARSAGQIAENATAVADVAAKTLAAAQRGQRSSESFAASMVRMRADNHAVADAVTRLNKRVAQIGKVVEFINDIADKSDLLALNAELEGTKAGEVGRGFSLVAAEMRRLSENVLRSTREIVRLIQEIRDATHAAVMATEAGVKATDRGTHSAHEVQQRIQEIFELARQTSEAVRSISLATQQQTTGTNQLAQAMNDILRVTQQGSTATQQMTASNLTLAVLAKELKVTVERFKLSEHA